MRTIGERYVQPLALAARRTSSASAAFAGLEVIAPNIAASTVLQQLDGARRERVALGAPELPADVAVDVLRVEPDPVEDDPRRFHHLDADAVTGQPCDLVLRHEGHSWSEESFGADGYYSLKKRSRLRRRRLRRGQPRVAGAPSATRVTFLYVGKCTLFDSTCMKINLRRLAAHRATSSCSARGRSASRTLLAALKPDLAINLASLATFKDYVSRAGEARAGTAGRPSSVDTVFVDEVQRVPALLDGIQALVDAHPRRFRFLIPVRARAS